MNFTYQGRHALAKLAFIAASSMAAIAISTSASTINWLTDIGCFDHVTPALS